MRPLRLLVLLVVAFPVVAAERTLLVSGIFADSSIVGPAVTFTTGDNTSNEYRLSVLGLTIDGEWVKRRSLRRALVLSADLTPVNAHLSNRIYLDGERAHELEYEAASYRIRAGFRFTPNERSTTDVRIAALVERVRDQADAAVTRFWDEPYAGVDVTHTWKRMRSESPLISSFDGVSVSARAEVYSGSETWSRLSLTQRAGCRAGNFHLRESLQVMTGKSLNVVSRFLVGGSWDVLAENALYGFRYGEFRVARGVVASAGADYALPRDWNVGIRASMLESDVADTHGFAVNATKTWKTIGFNFGAGMPQNRGGDSEVVLYLGVIAPLYAKGYN